MKKSSLTRALLIAGAVALAGVAQAETFDSPTQAGEASTMTHGAPNLLTTNQDGMSLQSSPMIGSTTYVDPGVDTTVLGAGPAVTGVETTTIYSYPSTHMWPERRDSAAASFNVPGRAGEASTMTNGVPNLQTTNPSAPVMHSEVMVPYVVTY